MNNLKIFNVCISKCLQGKLSLASKIHGLAERLQQLGKSSGDSVDGSDKGSRSRTGERREKKCHAIKMKRIYSKICGSERYTGLGVVVSRFNNARNVRYRNHSHCPVNLMITGRDTPPKLVGSTSNLSIIFMYLEIC